MNANSTNMEFHPGMNRGKTDLGWLQSRHSFSFGQFYDPDRLGFRCLRVINDDIVRPGRGFGEHGHDNMEIISWVLEGGLEHADSTGHRGVIRPGDAQVMTAGSGIRHSEMNPSATDPAHFLQIWIEPATRNVPPAYGQRTFPKDARSNRWQIIASPDQREQSMAIRQDAVLAVADLAAGKSIALTIAQNRYGYLHVARGKVQIGERTLETGHAISFRGPRSPEFAALELTQLLAFDLP